VLPDGHPLEAHQLHNTHVKIPQSDITPF